MYDFCETTPYGNSFNTITSLAQTNELKELVYSCDSKEGYYIEYWGGNDAKGWEPQINFNDEECENAEEVEKYWTFSRLEALKDKITYMGDMTSEIEEILNAMDECSIWLSQAQT